MNNTLPTVWLYYVATAAIVQHSPWFFGNSVQQLWYTWGDPATQEITLDHVSWLFRRKFLEFRAYEFYLVHVIEIDKERWLQFQNTSPLQDGDERQHNIRLTLHTIPKKANPTMMIAA